MVACKYDKAYIIKNDELDGECSIMYSGIRISAFEMSVLIDKLRDFGFQIFKESELDGE